MDVVCLVCCVVDVGWRVGEKIPREIVVPKISALPEKRLRFYGAELWLFQLLYGSWLHAFGLLAKVLVCCFIDQLSRRDRFKFLPLVTSGRCFAPSSDSDIVKFALALPLRRCLLAVLKFWVSLS